MSSENQYQVDLHTAQSSRATVRIRPQVINVLVGDSAPSFSFDRSGRLIGAFVDGCNYRRGLDNRVLSKWSDPLGRRQRRWLAIEEVRSFLQSAYSVAREAAEGTGDSRLEVLAKWDWEALDSDAHRFAQIYRPVSVLPPDQYLSLVVQATIGCSYNRCTFCSFYRDRAFHVKSPGELREHLQEVKSFFGPALSLRKSLFLADANALVAPMPRLRAWLDEIQRADLLRGAGIYSFIDAFDAGRKSTAEWQELSQRGLRRVYIGMESGSVALLRFLRKPGSIADAVEAVGRVKAAGVAASVIVMTGIGGTRFADDHVESSAVALNAMPLGDGDIIYFSPLVSEAASDYPAIASQLGIIALSEEEISAQELRIRSRLQQRAGTHGPICSRYDIREFVY